MLDARSAINLNVATIIWIVAVAISVAGCATSTDRASDEGTFYPPQPNPPRIQYLTSFSSKADVLGNATLSLTEYLFGEDRSSHVLEKPYGVAIFDGKIYAVDTRGHSYVIFDLVNRSYDTIYGFGQAQMKKPINITIDSDGTKYITDTLRNQVLLYDGNDQYLTAFGAEGQFRPGDTAIDGDRLFVADMQDHEIEVLDKSTGELLYKIGSVETLAPDRVKTEGVFFPTNLEIADGYLYASETGNFRVKQYSLDGKFITNHGDLGISFGSFVRPKGVALDRDGRMYIVDSAFENVQIMDGDGRLLLFFGSPGDQPGSINLPADIEIDYDHVHLFQEYAHPNFTLEYVILVSSQFGPSKIGVFGFGKMQDVNYPDS